MKPKTMFHVIDLYQDYLRRFLAWREFYKRGIKLEAFGKDVVWSNMAKYSALMDVMLRVSRSNEAEKKRKQI